MRCATRAARSTSSPSTARCPSRSGDERARRRAGRRLGDLHERVVGALLPRRGRHARRPAPGLDRPGHERGAARARLRARPRGHRSHAGRARRGARERPPGAAERAAGAARRATKGAGVPSSGLSAAGSSSSRSRGTRRTIGHQLGRSSRTGRSSNHGRDSAPSHMASSAKTPKTAGGSRMPTSTSSTRARLRRSRQAVNDVGLGRPHAGSAGRGRLALGGDAGHRVGPALGLVLALRAAPRGRRAAPPRARRAAARWERRRGCSAGRSWPTRYPASERCDDY